MVELQNHLKEIKRGMLENLSEILSAVFVLVLTLVLVYFSLFGFIENILQYIIITIVGSAFMLLIGFEKRARIFDKYVSLVVVFFLSLSFLFL